MPRPPKLTDAFLAELEAIVDDVWSINDACARLGIHPSTWREWRKEGDRDMNVGDDTIKAAFSALAMRAGAPKRRELAWSTLRSVLHDPDAKLETKTQAALGLLRLDNAARMELSGPEGGPIPAAQPQRLDLSKLSDEDVRQLEAITAKLEGGKDGAGPA